MEPPRLSWLPVPLQTARSPSVLLLLHTASRSLSSHCTLSIQVSPPVGRMRLPLAPTRGSPLLITDAKVSRSSRCVSISIPV